jgi:hypothetical protein
MFVSMLVTLARAVGGECQITRIYAAFMSDN